jgi:hypothetical protein
MAAFSFFLGSLVPTFVVSRLVLWLLSKVWNIGYELVIVSNVMSLLFLATIYWSGQGQNYKFSDAVMADAPGQLIALLIGVILQSLRGGNMDKYEREWNERVDKEHLRCIVCKKPPQYADQVTFDATGMCIACAEIQEKPRIGSRK